MSWTRRDIKNAFFGAMMDGFVNLSADRPKKKTILELLDSKITKYEHVTAAGGKLTVVDCWQTTPRSNASFGTTTISDQAGIVWMMQYHGVYDSEVIPFLKEALRQSYSRKNFHGGRGPLHLAKNGMIYTNRVTYAGSDVSYDHFFGREEICDEDGHLFGWHEYHGMLMT